MEQRINYVTLAVADVGRSRAFYVDGLGWEPALEAPGEVLMIPVGAGLVLSLWARSGFVEEVGEPSSGLAPVTLAYNVVDEASVDEAVARAVAAGATLVGPPTHREWGGYTGYVADPDGYRWEIAHNPSEMGLAQVHDSQADLRARQARRPGPAGGALRTLETFSGFAVDDVDAARRFYADVLGLEVSERHGMLGLGLGGGHEVLVYPKPGHVPAEFTVLNLRVADVEAAVDQLVQAGVAPVRYDGTQQDERGIFRLGGPYIAWFRDPAGNVFSVLQDR